MSRTLKWPGLKPTNAWTDYVFVFPVSGPLTRLLLRWRVPPTWVTICSILFGVAASMILVASDQDLAARMRWSGALFFFSIVLDNVDGQLARASRKTSEFGARLDHLGGSVVKLLALLTHSAVTFPRAGLAWWGGALVVLHYASHVWIHHGLGRGISSKSYWQDRRVLSWFSPFEEVFLMLIIGPLPGSPRVLAGTWAIAIVAYFVTHFVEAGSRSAREQA